jgi:hypothetical protein
MSGRGRPGKAGAAKRASFGSPVYSGDINDVLRQTIADLTFASNRNELIARMRNESLRTVQPKTIKSKDRFGNEFERKEYPKTVNYGGKIVPVEWVDIGEVPAWMGKIVGKARLEAMNSIGAGETVPLPKPVADSFRQLRRMDPGRPKNMLQKLSDTITGLDTTVTLQDAPRTLLRVIGSIAATRGLGAGSRIGKIMDQAGGIPRFILAATKALDVSKRDQPVFDLLARHGALDMRSVGEVEPLAEGSLESAVFKLVPGAPLVQKVMFGQFGAMNRARVASFKLLKDIGYSDADAINEVMRIYGTIVKDLQPGAVQALTKSTIDPYGNALNNALQSAFRSFGVAGGGTAKERIAKASGTAVGILTNAFLVKLLEDDEDKSIRTGLPASMQFYADRDRYKSLFDISKTFNTNEERLLRLFGVTGFVENARLGNISWETADRALRYTVSQWVNRLGPALQVAGHAAGLDQHNFQGKEIPKPTAIGAIVSGLPAGDAIMRAYRDEEDLAMKEGREIDPMTVAGMSLLGSVLGVARSKPKTETQVLVDRAKMDKAAAGDKIEKVALEIWGSGALRDQSGKLLPDAKYRAVKLFDPRLVEMFPDPIERAKARDQVKGMIEKLIRSDRRTWRDVEKQQQVEKLPR